MCKLSKIVKFKKRMKIIIINNYNNLNNKNNENKKKIKLKLDKKDIILKNYQWNIKKKLSKSQIYHSSNNKISKIKIN